MAAQDSDQEPSIEEILSSIRQIISDDDEEIPASAPPKPKASEPVAPPPPPSEVIELTNKVDDFAAILSQETEASDPDPIEVAMQEATPEVEEYFAPEPAFTPPPRAPEPPPRPAPKPQPVESDMDSILTSRAENAAISGFAELARKTAVEYNGITLEEIVRTELKPMLREWLDRNLPSIIERLVQEELERVSKRALED